MPTCSEQVPVRRLEDRTHLTKRCGTWYNGARVYCATCEEGMSFPAPRDYAHDTSMTSEGTYPLFI